MEHQSIVQILLQTQNHYVLGFQSAVDPVNQCLQDIIRLTVKTSNLSSFCTELNVSVTSVPNEIQRETMFFSFFLINFRDNIIQ